METIFTERKALEITFRNLEEEKKQRRAEYRQDIDLIEKRQYYILDRLQHLDGQEREAIDTEAVLKEITAIAQELGSLIPQVAATDVIAKMAEKLAADEANMDMIRRGMEKTDPVGERVQAAAIEQKVNSKPQKPKPAKRSGKVKAGQTGVAQGQTSTEAGVQMLIDILEEHGRPIPAKTIEMELQRKHNKKFANIHGAIIRWMGNSDGRIQKIGSNYQLVKQPQGETVNV